MPTRIRSAAAEAFERQLMRKDSAIVEEWKHYLDAPGAPEIKDDLQRWTMARVLRNSSEALALMENTQSTSVFGTNYQKALLGMTRQVFPRLMGTNLVAVQPMDQPTGQIFHLALTRQDGSTLGRKPSDNMSDIDSAAMFASRTYADHGTQGVPAPGEGDPIQKSMALSITGTPVTIGNAKKLKTEATLELVQDLQAYHRLNALDLLQGAAVDEIAQEIDAMIVHAIRQAAIAHKTVTFGQTAPAGWDANDWRHRLQRAILVADKQIYLSSGRRANRIICGPGAYLEMADLNTFKMAPDAAMEGGNYGLQPVGSLGSQYEVMMSRYLPDEEIILARRGEGFLDAGIVYAPYIALFVSERFFDVDNQKTSQSFASRFGLFTVSNTLYARVLIDEDASGIA